MPLIPPGVRVQDLSTRGLMSQSSVVASPDRAFKEGAENILGRDFNPGLPIAPRDQENTNPRQFQYPVGVNSMIYPRGEYPALTGFPNLMNLASLYDAISIAIAVRIEEMQGLPLQFVSVNKKEQGKWTDLCQELTNFWQQPDGLNSFDAWMGMVLYDLFTIDAVTLYPRPDLGGRIYGIDTIDGSTIKPLLDSRGRTEGYQQILWGYPTSEYERPSSNEKSEKIPLYSTSQLMYLPRWTRNRFPYGYPPTEWIILRVNTALRKQTFDLAYFTDGNIPEMLVDAPEGYTPDQVREFETWFNALLAGNDAARRRAKFMPWKSNARELRPFSFQTELDWWMFRIAAAAYGVPPMEMGFTDGVNKASSEIQQAVNERRGIKPLTNWLCRNIFNPLTRALGRPSNASSYPSISVYGLPTRAVRGAFDHIEAQYQFGEPDDLLSKAQADKIYSVDIGAIGKNEIRTLRFGDELEGPAPEALAPPPAPVVATTVATPPTSKAVDKTDEEDEMDMQKDIGREWDTVRLERVRLALKKFVS